MKKLILLLFLIPHLASAEEKMIPVAGYIDTHPKWQSSLYETFYVAMRCGFSYLEAAKVMKDDAVVSSSLDYMATIFLRHTGKHLDAALLKKRIILHSTESLGEEIDHISAFYKQEVPASYNGKDWFNGIVGEDMSTCESHYEFFEGLIKGSS